MGTLKTLLGLHKHFFIAMTVPSTESIQAVESFSVQNRRHSGYRTDSREHCLERD